MSTNNGLQARHNLIVSSAYYFRSSVISCYNNAIGFPYEPGLWIAREDQRETLSFRVLPFEDKTRCPLFVSDNFSELSGWVAKYDVTKATIEAWLDGHVILRQDIGIPKFATEEHVPIVGPEASAIMLRMFIERYRVDSAINFLYIIQRCIALTKNSAQAFSLFRQLTATLVDNEKLRLAREAIEHNIPTVHDVFHITEPYAELLQIVGIASCFTNHVFQYIRSMFISINGEKFPFTISTAYLSEIQYGHRISLDKEQSEDIAAYLLRRAGTPFEVGTVGPVGQPIAPRPLVKDAMDHHYPRGDVRRIAEVFRDFTFTPDTKAELKARLAEHEFYFNSSEAVDNGTTFGDLVMEEIDNVKLEKSAMWQYATGLLKFASQWKGKIAYTYTLSFANPRHARNAATDLLTHFNIEQNGVDVHVREVVPDIQYDTTVVMNTSLSLGETFNNYMKERYPSFLSIQLILVKREKA